MRINLMEVLAAIAIVAIITAISCEQRQVAERPVESVAVSDAGGWRIESQCTFKAGYDNHVREILVITSPAGHRYLAVTGCGVTEIFQESRGKTSVTVEE